MHFHKIHHPDNFLFGQPARNGSLRAGRARLIPRIEALGQDVFRLRVAGPAWGPLPSQAELNTRFGRTGRWTLAREGEGFALRDETGAPFLETMPGRGFGVSGKAWTTVLRHHADMRFHGMGEKALGLELTGRRTKFWNTDVWADFDFGQARDGNPDPLYLSIPWLIVRRGDRYAGILVHNPYAVFMATAPDQRIAAHLDRENDPLVDFFIGAPDGAPDLFVIAGPTLPELVRKLQQLVGLTPRPPLWSLGYHQCRWGYRDADDLDRLDRAFRRHKFPCDGLWLDIDYMRGYRVFTLDSRHWKSPRQRLAALAAKGRRIVPILDPGVKVDPDYAVYRDGLKHDAFCRNPAGTPFVGFVWPGRTHFPDFSRADARRWWAGHVRDFARLGFAGAWIDMNDPATGSSEPFEMRFNRGRADHETFHNQYANGMAQATRDGFQQAAPGRRPFLLTRSGWIGIGRFSAAWTGDNFSNAHHLKQCIPLSLNLALSGVPFNGPDVPGFGGDASAELAEAWFKACFLFPFLRNHSAIGTREQEPWKFGPDTLSVIRHLVRLRYKLMPYLYNLFVAQSRNGSAILRPLFHDFANPPGLPLERVADQFLVGPALMQAPVLDPKATRRQVILPDATWFDARSGRWVGGNRRIRVTTAAGETPLFVRDGSLIPMHRGEPGHTVGPLNAIELHVFLSPGYSGEARVDYTADDGETDAHERGAETRIVFTARRTRGKLSVGAQVVSSAFGPVRIRFVVHGADAALQFSAAGKPPRRVPLASGSWRFTGQPLPTRSSRDFVVG